jgi:hypothetical protein
MVSNANNWKHPNELLFSSVPQERTLTSRQLWAYLRSLRNECGYCSTETDSKILKTIHFLALNSDLFRDKPINQLIQFLKSFYNRNQLIYKSLNKIY